MQQTNFTNVELRGFADDMPDFMGNRPRSYADGATKRVQLDSGAGFAPQGRSMHELGHIASFVAKPFTFAYAYSWTQAATTPAALAGTWDQTTAEWGAAAFEKAFASHYGNIAFWLDNAATPTSCFVGQGSTCYSSGAPKPGTDVEASSYPFSTNNCSTNAANPESRWPLSHMRYFWDVFDNHNDADGDSYSANQLGILWAHLAVLSTYDNGTDSMQVNEPWNADQTLVTEPDGRGSYSYNFHYQNLTGTSTNLLRVDNCSPP